MKLVWEKLVDTNFTISVFTKVRQYIPTATHSSYVQISRQVRNEFFLLFILE